MKNLIAIIGICLVSSLSMAQTTTENYIHSKQYKVKTQDGTTNAETSGSLSSDDKIESISYYDGLGRIKQTVNKQVGGNKQDAVIPVVYDKFGRQAISYLPYSNPNQTAANSSLDYRNQSSLISDLETTYLNKFPEDLSASTNNPYSQKVFEDSPLNRVIEQASPGSDWAYTENQNDRTVKTTYAISGFEEVKKFSVSHPGGNTENTELIFDGYYPVHSLYKTILKDENWQQGQTFYADHTFAEYRDKQGRLVLKRNYDAGESYDTYYVYDNYNNLSYVLPPLASDQIIDEGALGFRVASQTNYSWTDLVEVDSRFAEEYNRRLSDYSNEDLLNADVENEYGGYGGFTITTHNDSDLVTLSMTFTANEGFPLKLGELISLRDYGSFRDTELGRIEGSDYTYLFHIRNDAIIIEKQGSGDGKLTGINQTFSSDVRLTYAENYPWTVYSDIDSREASNYESQLRNYSNDQILSIIVPNEYGGQGGVNVSIDTNDNITLTFNSSTSNPVRLKEGTLFSLNARRVLSDRDLGVISLNGTDYLLRLVNNTITSRALNTTSTISVINKTVFSSPPTTLNSEIETVEGLCYIYHHDIRNRIIEKKIPGKDWEYVVYDRFDRPILVQDANLKANNEWMYTKYDRYNRVAYTGLYQSLSDRVALQNYIDAQGDTAQIYETRTDVNNPTTLPSDTSTSFYYTTNALIPDNQIVLHTVNYYDDYNVNLSGDLSYQDSYGQQLATRHSSLPTTSKIRVLGTDSWITNVTYYDYKGRAIFTVSKNEYLSTIDYVKMKLDFVGKILETETTHTNVEASTTIVTIDKFKYDHVDRLLTHTQSINGNAEDLLVNNTYDELGQLIIKKTGGDVASVPENSNGLQTIDYEFNIRGWLKTVNNGTATNGDLFGYKLNYNTSDISGTTKLFNGNISEVHWVTANDNINRNYQYSYDALNRLVEANFNGGVQSFPNNVSQPVTQNENYSVKDIRYDKNGNLTHLERYGIHNTYSGAGVNSTMDIVDGLDYFYAPNSNKLINVTDFADNAPGNGSDDIDNGVFLEDYEDGDKFEYDINGNLTKDHNKEINNIEYNHLNLPTKVTFIEGNQWGNNEVEYIYDAMGTKLVKKVNTYYGQNSRGTKTRAYAGSYIYEKFSNATHNGTYWVGNDVLFSLKTILNSEGYVEPSGGNTFNYVYQYKDHLDNIRLYYAENPSTEQIEIREEKNFYPFGATHTGYNNVVNGVSHPYGFGGKEENEELGIQWLDFGARNYDASIGRWMNVDPLAEKMRRHSPYNYAFNNPIFFIDPDGRMATQGYNTGSQNPTWSDGGDSGVSVDGINDVVDKIVNDVVNSDRNNANSNESEEESNSDSSGCDSDCLIKNHKRQMQAHSIKFDMAGLDKDSEEYKRLSKKRAILLTMISDSRVQSTTQLQWWEYPIELLSAGNFSKIKLAVTSLATIAPVVIKYSDDISLYYKQFKSFSKSNYRFNLMMYTGKLGFLKDAHHIFPQTFEAFFRRANINIHHPEHMVWWAMRSHRSAAKAYNADWIRFMIQNPKASREQILNFGHALLKKYMN